MFPAPPAISYNGEFDNVSESRALIHSFRTSGQLSSHVHNDATGIKSKVATNSRRHVTLIKTTLSYCILICKVEFQCSDSISNVH